MIERGILDRLSHSQARVGCIHTLLNIFFGFLALLTVQLKT